MIIGQYYSKLTDKSRLSIPKKFRQEIGDDLVIARWYESCLVLVAKNDWEKLIRRLTGEGRIVTSKVRDIDRFISGLAYEVGLDKQGRFIVPDKLLVHSGIEDEAVFVGLKDRIEIWSRQNWEELEKKVDEKATIAIEQIAKNEPASTQPDEKT